MTTFRTPERGEGKIGCISSLVALVLVGAVLIKVVPVFYSNNNLVSAAEDLGSRAGVMNKGTVEQQLLAKVVELEIPEAAAKGATKVELQGDGHSGTCHITLHYTRKIDLYGIYTWSVETDKVISRPFMDGR
jgi:hypothetical protein